MTTSSENDFAYRMARARFRAWHRGTREADYTMGCYFDHFSANWNDENLAWFENLLEEEDVDILAWVMQQEDVPERFTGPMMTAMQGLDYVSIPQ